MTYKDVWYVSLRHFFLLNEDESISITFLNALGYFLAWPSADWMIFVYLKNQHRAYEMLWSFSLFVLLLLFLTISIWRAKPEYCWQAQFQIILCQLLSWVFCWERYNLLFLLPYFHSINNFILIQNTYKNGQRKLATYVSQLPLTVINIPFGISE